VSRWQAICLPRITISLSFANSEFTFANNLRLNTILQHYGAPTHYINLTHDFRVAAWFALHRAKRDTQHFIGTCMREITYICYERIKSQFGYILVLAFPDADGLQNNADGTYPRVDTFFPVAKRLYYFK
jgi:hypothetical protein